MHYASALSTALTVAPSVDHCFTDTVAPSSDHYRIDIAEPSSDHCYTETVPPSNDHDCTTKVANRTEPVECRGSSALQSNNAI